MKLFELEGKTAVILGGGGILGESMAEGLAAFGVNMAICDLNEKKTKKLAGKMGSEYGIKAGSYGVDATDIYSLTAICSEIKKEFNGFEILINAVGGNRKDATTSVTQSFFDLPYTAIQKVVELNLMAGAIIPSQIFGREMTNNIEGGVIINISSMNYYRPLTRTPGYSAAKAAVSNFTQWLAVDMAHEYGEKIRVNAIAPGFFLTDQNRYLLTDPDTGELNARGNQIIDHTPMGRFGQPSDLIGTLIWLVSDASKFVTGLTIPVDGGFSVYSGV